MERALNDSDVEMTNSQANTTGPVSSSLSKNILLKFDLGVIYETALQFWTHHQTNTNKSQEPGLVHICCDF